MGDRRRRSDAERSIAAILDAATAVLRERPHAGIAEIAKAAGVTRQTVYAHFVSRERLVRAVGDRALDETLATIAAARLEDGSPAEALERLLDLTWNATERLLGIPFADVGPQEDRELHRPILEPVEALIVRGQRAGAFDRRVPPSFLAAGFVALSHTAAEEAASGRMSPREAAQARRRAILRMFGIEPTP